MSAFQASLVRVLFATEIAGMGIDFPNVCRVIQWQVTPKLTAAFLWQRFGCAARNSASIGVAILYHPARVLLQSTKDHQLAILAGDVFHKLVIIPKILDLIEGFATSKIPTRTAHDPLDRDIKPPIPTPQFYDITDLFATLINGMLHNERTETQTIQDDDSG